MFTELHSLVRHLACRPPEHLCNWDVFGISRFKMYKGVLYAWRDDWDRYINWAQRFYR